MVCMPLERAVDQRQIEMQRAGLKQATTALDALIASVSRDGQLLEGAMRRLDKIADLRSDWNPYGAEQPSAWSIMTARQILGTLLLRFGAVAGDRIVPYHIAPMPDGGVQLKWRNESSQGWLMIRPDDAYCYLYEDRKEAGSFSEENDIPLERALDWIKKTIVPRP